MASQKEQLEELLTSYIDGVLSDDERKAVESYLDGHPDLRRDINEAIADSLALQSMPHVTAPSGLTESMEQHVERDALLGASNSSNKSGRNYAMPRFAIAAILLAGLGIGYFVYDKVSHERGTIAIELPRDDSRNSARENAGGEAGPATPESTFKPGDLADAAPPREPELDSRLGMPGTNNTGTSTQSMTAPAPRSLAFRNVAPAGDPDLMSLPESELTQDGRVLMKLNIDTQVVEAAEMSLAGFIADNQLELSNAALSLGGRDEAQAAKKSELEAVDKSGFDNDRAMTKSSAAESKQDGYFEKLKESDQIRRVAIVKNIRVDQIDTLRQLVDRAPGSNEATVVAIDNPEAAALVNKDDAGGQLQMSQTRADWSELERAAYRARPGDRLRIQIEDPESPGKSEEILTIDAEGKIPKSNLEVKGEDLTTIETAIADELEFSRGAGAARPRVNVDPLQAMPDSVHLEPEQVVDLLVIIQGPAPLPSTTAPMIEADPSELAPFMPATQPAESIE
ncbi:MAG TPA: hypothetical protein PK402_09065 [Tepidisphaeraceae bacterium]|nr:hypothetical protein [Tepidisphaeraceae bacterium]